MYSKDAGNGRVSSTYFFFAKKLVLFLFMAVWGPFVGRNVTETALAVISVLSAHFILVLI